VPNEQHADQRRFPEFLDRWREANGEDFTPIAYLSQREGPPFAIAAQWLFVPDFVSYRGGIFRTELPRGLGEREREHLDQSYAKFDGDVSEVEKIGNLLTLYDNFAPSELTPRKDEDLSQLARSIARSWDALLRVEFHDRTFQVTVSDDERSYGPQITFFQTQTGQG
jgi:hypothetical protein